MITQITGGSAPDVFYFGSGLSPSVIYNGKVEDLKPYLDKSEKLTYDMFTNEHMGTLSEYEGGIYGVCPDDNPMVLYYNADMFRDAGLKTPTEYWENGEWTIDKYVECMETIAGTSTKDSIQKYGAFFDFDWEVVMTYLNYFGADYYSEDSKTCTLDTSEAKKAIGLMKRLIDDEVAIGNLGAKDSNSISGSALFMSQQAATVFSGRWSTPTFKQVTDFEWDIVPFPTKDKGGLYAVTPGYTYVVMNADSKEKDASWTFIEDFVCPEGQIFRLADGGNATASVVGVNEKILSGGVPTSENLWIDLAEVSTWTPLNIAKYPEATQMILDGIKAIMMDQKEVESGLDDITSKVNDYLANPPF